ncbi:MAG: hypothetical protein ACQETB_01435 [Halobacteriota archaeon]
MIDDRLADGPRIAQVLASELTGDRDDLAAVTVTDANPDVDPTPEGAIAYRVAMETQTKTKTETQTGTATDPTTIAEVFVHPTRTRVEFLLEADVAADAAAQAELRVRPKAVHPPRTLVFVEDGAQVKWILPVFEAVVSSIAACAPT